jgi:hypothetical protein
MPERRQVIVIGKKRRRFDEERRKQLVTARASVLHERCRAGDKALTAAEPDTETGPGS